MSLCIFNQFGRRLRIIGFRQVGEETQDTTSQSTNFRISFMGRNSAELHENLLAQLGGCGPMLTQAPGICVLITTDLRAAMYRIRAASRTGMSAAEYDGLNSFQVEIHLEKAETQFIGRWPSHTSVEFRPREMMGDEHVPRGLKATTSLGSKKCVDDRPLQLPANLLDPPVSADDLDIKFQTYVNTDEKETIHLIVFSGSSNQNQQQWETAYFCFDLAGTDPNSEDAVSKMLDARQQGTLFALAQRETGDHNSVVVLKHDFCRYLIRVKQNVDNFDERPLVIPYEESCPSAIRMLKYGRILTMKDKVCTLGAACSTRQYFGLAFDAVFRSYAHFCDSMYAMGKKRIITWNIDVVDQTARWINAKASNREASYFGRVYGHTFGGDESGQFETMTDELGAMEEAAAYTGRCAGAFKIMCFPSHPDEIFVFHAGEWHTMPLEQVREAARSFCEAHVGTVANGLEVLCVRKYISGLVTYCVRDVECDSFDINEFRVVYGHHLFPQQF